MEKRSFVNPLAPLHLNGPSLSPRASFHAMNVMNVMNAVNAVNAVGRTMTCINLYCGAQVSRMKIIVAIIGID